MQKLKISKQNIDVLGTAGTVPNNLIFDSDLNSFKIISSGTVGATITSDGQTITVAHGQSIRPAIYAFCKFSDGFVSMPNQTDRSFTSTGSRNWIAEFDSTNMYFIFNKGVSGNYNPVVKWFVYEAPV